MEIQLDVSSELRLKVKEYVEENYMPARMNIRKHRSRRKYFWSHIYDKLQMRLGVFSLKDDYDDLDKDDYYDNFDEIDSRGNKHLKAFSLRDDDDDSEIDAYSGSSHKKHSANLQKMLAGREKTFQEKLFEIIDERGLTGPEVYTNYISRQTYSKIQSDKYYRPTKYTAIALCLSLHLDIKETLDLMARAGQTLSPSNKADIVVKACIINKEYNIVNIDILLADNGCDQLTRIR